MSTAAQQAAPTNGSRDAIPVNKVISKVDRKQRSYTTGIYFAYPPGSLKK